ncbi:hypothetical protein Kpho02_74160 [Kitasatospora phosalacinea]|uniref:Uncharacterized protein n=1 Tax=Kitasatospora phosalacinea TaxID=2065 RepID=A0A9W6QFE9_9ACTN|nr:hypothetical protein [Kitasatospora phosalacinea]GLW75119.1 hypothetical protein Kpho02_74160 [Kitasatospora phosalacinea]
MDAEGSGRRSGRPGVWAGLTSIVLLVGGLAVFARCSPPEEYSCDNSNYPTRGCTRIRHEPASTGSTFRCPTDWWEYRSLGREAAAGCAMTRPSPLPCPTTPDTYWVAKGEDALAPGCLYPRTAVVPPSAAPSPGSP